MTRTYGIGQAMAQPPLPAGWAFSYLHDAFLGPNGETVSRTEFQNHNNSIDQVLVHRAYEAQKKLSITNIPTTPGSVQQAVSSMGSLSISNATQPAAKLSFETDHGRVTLDIKTGDLTLPVAMSREDSIREFWTGFQKHFKSTDEHVYQSKIKSLEQEVARAKALTTNEGAKKVAEKIAKKYGGEKFIMVKPEDLIRFIEEA